MNLTLSKNFKSRSTARRHRISVIRTVRTNERGYTKDAETEIGTYWASVYPLSEQLRIQYETMNVRATHSITVDGRTDVQEKDKIKFGDRVFEILTIKQVDESDRDKVIITEEIRPKNTISTIPLPKPEPEIEPESKPEEGCNSTCNCDHGDSQIVVVGDDPDIFTFHNPPWQVPYLGGDLKISVYEGAQFPLVATLTDVGMNTAIQVLHDIGTSSPPLPRWVKVIYTSSNVQYGSISALQGFDNSGYAGGGTLHFKGPIEFIIGWVGYGWKYPTPLHEVIAVKTNGQARYYLDFINGQANSGDYGFEIWD